MATGNPPHDAGGRIWSSLEEGGSGGSVGSLVASGGVSQVDLRRIARPCLHAGLLGVAVLVAWLTTDATGVPTASRLTVWLIPPLVLALLAARGTYRRCIQLDMVSDLMQMFTATSLAAITVLALGDLLDPVGDSARLVVRAWLLATLFLCASVPLLTAAERSRRRSGNASVPTLLVGAGEVGTRIERRLREEPELGLNVVGYIDADPAWDEAPAEDRAPVLGTPEELTKVAAETGARHVIFTFTSSPDQTLVPLIRSCEERGVQVSLVPRMFERVNHRASLESIGRVPLFSLDHIDPKGWQFALKHVFDRIASAGMLALLSPLLAATAVAVRVSSPGPVMFRQSRVGRDGRRFEMLKFRSMRVAPAKSDCARCKPGLAPGGVEGEDRRTAVGGFIRRYSLDELPQLFNVLKGDMSLVGPRPERPEFVQLFDEEVRGYSDRHRVKSGITGLAQTKGLRGQTSLTDRIELDNFYIQHWSMMLDVKILFATVGTVVRSAE